MLFVGDFSVYFYGLTKEGRRFPGGSVVKNPPAHAEDMGWEDPLQKEMATHSSILAGKSRAQRSLAGYSPWDCK